MIYRLRLTLLALLGLTAGVALGTAGVRLWQQGRPSTSSGSSIELIFWRTAGPQPGLWAVRPDGGGLHLVVPIAGDPRPFAVGPQGQIAYSMDRLDGGADIWELSAGSVSPHMLIDCPGAVCESPAWSPDGRLAYERRPLPTRGGDAQPGSPAVWLWDRSGPRLLSGQDPEEQPHWARTGLRLATYRPDVRAVVLRDLATGAIALWPSAAADLGDWSPDGRAIAFGDIASGTVETPTIAPDAQGAVEALPTSETLVQPEEQDRFEVHLFLGGFEQGAPVDLSAGSSKNDVVNDAGAAWSPDGRWIAFGRQIGSGGRQLWLIDPAGRAGRAVLEEAGYNHAAFAWSPVPLPGHADFTLAMVRKDLSDLTGPPEIWLVEEDGSGLRRLVSDGIMPQWWLAR